MLKNAVFANYGADQKLWDSTEACARFLSNIRTSDFLFLNAIRMMLSPVPGNIRAAAYPDLIVALNIIEKIRQCGGASRAAG